MDQMPFQAPQESSEMAIVKAGLDTDQDGWGEFLCAYTDMPASTGNYLIMYEANADNSYEVIVQVSDGSYNSTQNIIIKVINADWNLTTTVSFNIMMPIKP